MKHFFSLLAVLVLLIAVSGCSSPDAITHATIWGSHWRAEPLRVISGLAVPECALYNARDNSIFISNIESAEDEYWSDDAKGYIDIIAVETLKPTHRWVNSSPAFTINGPKGMCLLDGKLYVTDNTRLLRCDTDTGANLEIVASGFQQANDLATDGENIWLSDTMAGKVFCISPDGVQREIPAPAGINGITFSGDKLFAVSWDLHDLYELDPLGIHQPEPFGLADHFTNLDGIEVMPDGAFIVSDFYGNKVSAVTADRREVYTLAEIETPADIDIDPVNRLLYVPQFMHDKLAVYRLIYGD